MCLNQNRFAPSARKVLFVAHVVQQLKARLRSKMGTDSSEEHAKAEHVNHEVDEVWHTKQTTTPLVPDHGGSISHPNKIFQLSTCLE